MTSSAVTADATSPADDRPPAFAAVRASMVGTGVAMGLWGVGYAIARVFGADAEPAAGANAAAASAAAGASLQDVALVAAAGVLAAGVAGVLTAVLHGRLVGGDGGSRGAAVEAASVTRALTLGFLIKVGALGVGFAALLLAEVKFEFVAAFALAFAAASLLIQLFTAALLNRALSLRGSRGVRRS